MTYYLQVCDRFCARVTYYLWVCDRPCARVIYYLQVCDRFCARVTHYLWICDRPCARVTYYLCVCDHTPFGLYNIKRGVGWGGGVGAKGRGNIVVWRLPLMGSWLSACPLCLGRCHAWFAKSIWGICEVSFVRGGRISFLRTSSKHKNREMCTNLYIIRFRHVGLTSFEDCKRNPHAGICIQE